MSVNQNYFEEAIGEVNGSNKIFTTPKDYVPGTLRVFRNGRLITKQYEDGFEEILTPSFSMKIAPEIGDNIFVFYEEWL